MPIGTYFTGSDAWVATLVGPANTDDLTAESVVDAMVQQSNRTIWLSARIDDAYQRRHLDRIEIADAGSAYAATGNVTNVAFTAMASFHKASQAIGTPDGLLLLDWQGTLYNDSTLFGEVRLQCTETGPTTYVSSHWRCGSKAYTSARLLLLVPDPTTAADFTGTLTNVGLYARTEDAVVISTVGSGSLDIWKLTKVEVP
jgi:hypothetical protein